MGDPGGNGEEGSVDGHVCSLGTVRDICRRGSGNGASLSMGALLGEPGKGASLLEALKVIKGRLWGQGNSLSRGSMEGASERAPFTGEPER